MKKTGLVVSLFLTLGILNAQEVKINNNLVIEADGTVRMDSSSTVWGVEKVALDKGASAASFGFMPGTSSGPQILYFKNGAGVEAMSFTFLLPPEWKEGTTIYPYIHWTPKNSLAGNVEWNLEYTWANYDAVTPKVFPAITTSAVVATGAFTQCTHLVTPLTSANVGIGATGKTISSILICRIWRDSSRAADTYNDDAGGISIAFHYEIDTFGSRLEGGK